MYVVEDKSQYETTHLNGKKEEKKGKNLVSVYKLLWLRALGHQGDK